MYQSHGAVVHGVASFLVMSPSSPMSVQIRPSGMAPRLVASDIPATTVAPVLTSPMTGAASSH
jgi:hypothetical protein